MLELVSWLGRFVFALAMLAFMSRMVVAYRSSLDGRMEAGAAAPAVVPNSAQLWLSLPCGSLHFSAAGYHGGLMADGVEIALDIKATGEDGHNRLLFVRGPEGQEIALERSGGKLWLRSEGVPVEHNGTLCSRDVAIMPGDRLKIGPLEVDYS